MDKTEIYKEYKELVRYGSIMRNFEIEDKGSYHRIMVFSYQGMEFTVTMLNGDVITVNNTTIF